MAKTSTKAASADKAKPAGDVPSVAAGIPASLAGQADSVATSGQVVAGDTAEAITVAGPLTTGGVVMGGVVIDDLAALGVAAKVPSTPSDAAPGPAGQVFATGGMLPESLHLVGEGAALRPGWLAPAILGFEVSAARDGFRRAGRAWMREPEFVSQDAITEEQVELLRADPNIRIFPAQRPAPSEDGAQ